MSSNNPRESQTSSDAKNTSNSKAEKKLDLGPIDDPTVVTDKAPVGWGFDMYPERRGRRPFNFTNFFIKDQYHENLCVYRCESKILEVIRESPVVRIMMNALKKAGCPINIRRHLNCEYCEFGVTGGFDPMFNQIVICYNMAKTYGIVENILFHEMIHMFDYCTGNLDFTNVEHVACTEVRAANLTYCNFSSGFFNGDFNRRKLKRQHRLCVRNRAIESVLAARAVSLDEAIKAVEKVFKKCYKDMEPIGRQMKGHPYESMLAYSEAFMFGYD